jgi:hypothetical protein
MCGWPWRFSRCARAAAELGENCPGLELRVRALAGRAELRVGAVGLFLRLGLVLPLIGDLRPGTALISLIGQDDEALGFQFVQHAPDPLGLLSWTEPGSAPDTHRMSPSGLAMTCRFTPVLLVPE